MAAPLARPPVVSLRDFDSRRDVIIEQLMEAATGIGTHLSAAQHREAFVAGRTRASDAALHLQGSSTFQTTPFRRP